MKPASEVINDTIDPEETPRIMKAIPVPPQTSGSSAIKTIKAEQPASKKMQTGPQPFSARKQNQKGRNE